MKDKKTVTKTQAFWVGEIETYEQQFGPWEKRCKKIVDRYMDERKGLEEKASKFNILWSNIQTLQPAIYASPPTPNIDRRFDNDDDLGRYSALVLERAVSYYVKNDLFDRVMKQATLDRLLPGRGVAWVRYCPVFEEKLQITDDSENKDYEEEAPELLVEDTVPDYVHWQDFGHTWGRTWQEVRGVWRRVFMSRTELVKRFGEAGQTVPLDAEVKGKNSESISTSKKATIYEIWDKAEKKVIWLHVSMEDVLEEVDDPLGLKDFFPCPEPIYSTISNDNLIPSPDYIQYQDQADELDNITARIESLTKAVKVAGVYDSSAQGIDRLLSEGVENKLIPVDQFAVLGGGKGLAGAMSFLPLQEVMQALMALYEARERVKQDLYEITGISDIVRGATNPNETLGAQELKGQFATLRLDDKQKDVARFAKDLVVIMTEIIAKHFSLDTIKQVSGVKLMTQEEKQMAQMQIQQAQQQYQMVAQQAQAQQQEPPPPPEIPEDIKELLDLPTWEEVEQLIRNDTARNFRIDIETDSTIKTDQENEKKSRVEFLSAVSGFLQQAVNIPPELRNLTMELLMFGVRGFKISRELETTFESTMRDIRAMEEQEPQPNPELEAEKMRMEQETQKFQTETQMKAQQEGQKAQLETAKLQQDRYISEREIELEQQKIELEKQKLTVELIKAQLDARNKAQEVSQQGSAQETNDMEVLMSMINNIPLMLNEGLQSIAAIQAQGNEEIVNILQNSLSKTQ